jgi:hypothetical protein
MFQGNGHRPGTGTEIQEAEFRRRPPDIDEFQGRFNQDFRIRPGNQNFRGNGKFKAPEFPAAQDPGHTLPGEPPPEGLVEKLPGFRGKGGLIRQDETGPIQVEDLPQEQRCV